MFGSNKYENRAQPYLINAILNDHSERAEECRDIRNKTIYAAIALRNMNALYLKKFGRYNRLSRRLKALVYDAEPDWAAHLSNL